MSFKLGIREIAEYLKYDINSVKALVESGTISQRDSESVIHYIISTKSEREFLHLPHT